MAARLGLITVINRLRSMTDAGTADYTLPGMGTLWSDEQLQDVLDGHRSDLQRVPLRPASGYTGGAVEFRDYSFPAGDVEEAASGTAVWRVEDGSGSLVGTADYTVTYRAGHVRFNADTGGADYYLTTHAFDVERAAAEVWEQKAAHVSSRFDIRTDNHDLKRSQLRAAYLQNASEWHSKAKSKSVTMVREDVEGAGLRPC
jgi:hypothetical protein